VSDWIWLSEFDQFIQKRLRPPNNANNLLAFAKLILTISASKIFTAYKEANKPPIRSSLVVTN
jgi:hypothetical protein